MHNTRNEIFTRPRSCCIFLFKKQAKNADFFKQYVTEEFTTYLNRKRMDSCHGNHVEMQALSELYNRPIEVYQYGGGMFSKFNFSMMGEI